MLNGFPNCKYWVKKVRIFDQKKQLKSEWAKSEGAKSEGVKSEGVKSEWLKSEFPQIAASSMELFLGLSLWCAKNSHLSTRALPFQTSEEWHKTNKLKRWFEPLLLVNIFLCCIEFFCKFCQFKLCSVLEQHVCTWMVVDKNYRKNGAFFQLALSKWGYFLWSQDEFMKTWLSECTFEVHFLEKISHTWWWSIL